MTNTSGTKKDTAYSQAVHAEKERLFASSDAELLRLPGYSTVERTVAGIQLSVGLWHQSRKEGFEVFVAQAKGDVLLGFGHMFVAGFILRPDGSRGPLPDLVFFDYA
jgi:hypothetical protein